MEGVTLGMVGADVGIGALLLAGALGVAGVIGVAIGDGGLLGMLGPVAVGAAGIELVGAAVSSVSESASELAALSSPQLTSSGTARIRKRLMNAG